MNTTPTPLAIADLLEEQEAIAKRNLEIARRENLNEREFEYSNSTSRDPRRLPREHDGEPTSKRSRDNDASSPRLRDPDRGQQWRSGHHSSNDRYLSEREENDERRSRRSKDLAEDDTTKPPSENESANGSVRSRRRSRSPRPESRHGETREYRNRSRSRSRDRRSGGDYYVGGGRPSTVDRNSSRYTSFPPGERRRERSADRRDSHRRYGRNVDSYRGGHGRRSPDPTKRKTPEPTTDERDRRTVFVQQLAARLRSKELREFFEQAGHVVDAQIVKDRVSQRSKGVGYVEFKEEESVEKAIQLTGQKLLGIPIIAQLTEAEKNRQARTTEGTATQSNGIPFHRLYVGNIHFSITEDDLKNVFEPFGDLEFVQLQKEEGGRSKGYGFVQFHKPEQAKEALEKMNGFELAGRPIRVGLGNDKFTAESTESLKQRFGSQANAGPTGNQGQGSSFSGMGGRGTHAGGTGNFDRAGGRDNDKAGGSSALDDSDVGGVNFQNFNRDSLMRKLARMDEPAPKVAPKTFQQKPVAEAPAPTRCVLLKNMYDQNEETGPSWKKELEEDVKIECEEKYGKVVHLGLALDNNDGEIYIKFDRVQGGENAFRGLNGRWFGGRQITAQYVVEAVYHMNFPKAANV